MSLHSADDIRFHLVFHALAAEIAIESACSAAECVLLVLVVVLFELVNDSSSHVRVVLARAESRDHDGAHLLVQVGTKEPAWCKDDPEEQEDKRDTLFGILNER